MYRPKSKLLILIIFCFTSFTLFQSCNSKNNRNGISEDYELINIKEYKYERQWLEYVFEYPDSTIVSKFEVYLTKDSDTIYQQYKYYKNNVLDSTKSTFYTLDFNKKDDSIYYGRIYYHSQADYEYKSPIIEKNLGLAFLHSKRDTTKVWDFESKNKDYVEFEYTHTNDTLIGMLYETRLLDTIINGERMVRILETGIPIDNITKTNNPFIEAFDLDENKYVR